MAEIKTEDEAIEILEVLKETHPQPETELNYENPFQLLIAVILSAQTTDKQVNKVTSKLFKKFKTPEEICKCSPEEFQQHISSLGLYRNKSKYIVKTCCLLVDEYNGKVPDTRKELMKLSGVGRKTANVIISSIYDKDAIAVDTHVFRVSKRIGLAKGDKVDKVETELMELIPKRLWSSAHHWLIFQGRSYCKARNPNCKECPITDYCNYYAKAK